MRESPDVILLGEMRDYETIGTAVTAAEMAQLLFSTLHTTGAAGHGGPHHRRLSRLAAAPDPHAAVHGAASHRVASSSCPPSTASVVPAFEIMVANTAIRNLIREEKTHQMDSVIAAGGSEGMRTMDQSLFDLREERTRGSSEMALQYSIHQEALRSRLDTEGL